MARKASQTAGLIKLRCPNKACGKILAVKPDMGGKKARCPLCGQTMAIPKVKAPAAGPPEEEAPAPPRKEAEPPEEKVEKKEEKKEEKKPSPPAEEKKAERETEKKVEPKPAPPPEKADAGPSAKAEETEAPAPGPKLGPGPRPRPEPEPEPQAAEPPPPPSRPGAESIKIGAPRPGRHPTPRTLKRVAEEAAETGYELLGGQLRVVGAIGYDLNTGFRDKCDALLASGEKELTVDLSQVLYLSSSHIGVIARLATDAMAQDRKVKVRVNNKVARVLKFAGVERLAEIENVDE